MGITNPLIGITNPLTGNYNFMKGDYSSVVPLLFCQIIDSVVP